MLIIIGALREPGLKTTFLTPLAFKISANLAIDSFEDVILAIVALLDDI